MSMSGDGRRTPSSTIQTRPPFSHTSTRAAAASGSAMTKAMPTGWLQPPATGSLTNSGGHAAEGIEQSADTVRHKRLTARPGMVDTPAQEVERPRPLKVVKELSGSTRLVRIRDGGETDGKKKNPRSRGPGG